MAAAIQTILEQCLSPRPEERVPAEKTLLNALQSNPAEALSSLIQIFNLAERPDLQQLSCVYVRRTFKTQTQLFPSLQENVQDQFKSYLLTALVKSSVKLNIRR